MASSANPSAGPSSANPPSGPSSANPPIAPSPAIVDYTTPFKTMIILYFGHYRFHEFAIKLLVKKKTKNPHCDARVQRDEEVVVFAEFARNEWAYSDVNIGRYIAQGQTDPAELDRAIGLTDEELVVIRDLVQIDQKPEAQKQNSTIYAAAYARLVENRAAQGLPPLPS
ncbi:MAG: hypothetical protein ASARMPRED_003879 [Alectoria sarmentosa]|nr:MAG: hypothetical protein ASARMPRED_003879 [Alectoria sarmentosa]